MSLAYGQALSYSPLMYEPRERWSAVYAALVGNAVQPATAANETPDVLNAAAARFDAAFRRAAERIEAARIDALVVLVADRQRVFNAANTPQLHVFVGEHIWGDVGQRTR